MEALYMEIVKEQQKRLNCIGEILNITKDMEEAMSRNDRVSAQMLIGMRQEEMDRADRSSKNIDCLINSVTLPEQICLKEWLHGRETKEADSPMSKKIVELAQITQRTLERTIAIDKHMSKRLAGKDSFYEQNGENQK